MLDLGTPAPTYVPAPVPAAKGGAPTDYMDHHERLRMHAAAMRAKRVYPGPVGEVLSAELQWWAEIGWRLQRTSLVNRLVTHILTTPQPQPSR